MPLSSEASHKILTIFPTVNFSPPCGKVKFTVGGESIGPPPPPPPPPPSSTIRADFETGTLDSWELSWGSLSVANATDQHFTGLRSLKLTFTGGGWPAARMRATTGAAAGKLVTFHVYRPPLAPGAVGVLPYVSDSGWSNRYGPETALVAGWNTVTYVVPAGTPAPLQAIGLQVADHGWPGSLYVDAVAW